MSPPEWTDMLSLQKQPDNSSKVGLSIVIRACDDGLRLEWVLEGLCAQTMKNFEVIMTSRVGHTTIGSLVQRFENRLNITHCYCKSRRKILPPAVARNLGLQFARAPRTLFLDGDCLPDRDVAETHAHFGGRGFVPFGFRRIYSRKRGHRFTPPLDYSEFQRYATEDPRISMQLYGDWRDVLGFCLSAPTEVLCRMGGFNEQLSDNCDQDLARRLSKEMYRLLPLWDKAYVTYLGKS